MYICLPLRLLALVTYKLVTNCNLKNNDARYENSKKYYSKPNIPVLIFFKQRDIGYSLCQMPALAIYVANLTFSFILYPIISFLIFEANRKNKKNLKNKKLIKKNKLWALVFFVFVQYPGRVTLVLLKPIFLKIYHVLGRHFYRWNLSP